MKRIFLPEFITIFSLNFHCLASELLCCDKDMVRIMAQSINMATGIFGRCETCLKNLYKSVCALNCSPKQSEFMVGHKDVVEDDKGKKGEPLS